ncbi:MAG: hypothetical protein C3F06_04685 [Candidatus Methanoperedenaceae archaeon]|nr:MAG: hypothetical protein C3F06_04685 [Candidatus Methanoperedenaceae archaeon]
MTGDRFEKSYIDIGDNNTISSDTAGRDMIKPGGDYIGGDQIINPSNRPMHLPITDEPDFLLVLLRRVFKYLGVEKFFASLIILLFVSGYLALKPFFEILSGNFSNLNGSIIPIFGWLLFFSSFYIAGLYFTKICKNCGSRFAIRRINKLHLGSVEYLGSKHHEIKVTYICDYCKKIDNEEFTVSEQVIK